MIFRRLGYHARSSVPAFLFALAVAMALPCPAAARAVACSMSWTFAWRPGWILSDPPEVIFAPPTALRGTPAHPIPGLLVALDPETGLPTTPSAAQRRATAAALEGDDALLVPLGPLPVERAPGGGEIVHLQGRFQVFSVARRTADGRLITDCSLNPAAAQRLLSQPPPAESRWEEK